MLLRVRAITHTIRRHFQDFDPVSPKHTFQTQSQKFPHANAGLREVTDKLDACWHQVSFLRHPCGMPSVSRGIHFRLSGRLSARRPGVIGVPKMTLT